MDPPFRTQLEAHKDQPLLYPPGTAQSGSPQESEQSHIQSQQPHVSLSAQASSASQPAAYYPGTQITPYTMADSQRAGDDRTKQSQNQLPSTTQAPSCFVNQDNVTANQLNVPLPVPHQQTYSYNYPHRDERVGTLPDQQYEDYMRNTNSLGLAAALYHDSNRVESPALPRNSGESSAYSTSPVMARAGTPQLQKAEPAGLTTYTPFNPYERQGLIGPPRYYPQDIQMLPFHGGAMPNALPTALPGPPGYALLHPGSITQQPIVAAPATVQPMISPHSPESMKQKSFESRRGSRSRTRASVRFHECAVCGKRFGRPSALQTHVHSHTGEKPYKCDIENCARCFSVLSNLRRHQRVHHGVARPGSLTP